MQDNRRKAADNLIRRVAEGDRGAFDSLYRTTADWLHALALSMIGDRQQAETALQDVFRQVWTQADAQKGSGLSVLAWLVALTRARALQGRAAPVLATTGGDPVTIDAARLTEVLATLAEGESATLRDAALKGTAPADPAAFDAAVRAIAAPPEPAAADEVLAAKAALGLLDDAGAADATRRQATDPGFAERLRGWHERIALLATGLTPVLLPARARLALDRSLGHAMPSDMGDIVIRSRPRPTADRGDGRFWIVLLAVLILGGAAIVLWPQIAQIIR